MKELYKDLLLRYVTEGGEPDLELAYEFGRQALNEGVGVLHVVETHYAALSDVLSEQGVSKDSALLVQRAGNLLKEALGAYEMTQLGYKDTIALLRSQNEKLERLVEERAELVKQREDFMMVVTHDLKTPITAADRCLSLMLDGDFGPLTAPQAEVLATMKDSNHRMFTMIKNLLDVYRYEHSVSVLSLTKVDANSLIRSVVKEFELAARARECELQVDLDEDLYFVLADELALQHVFFNLVDNALKFVPKGGVITLSARNSDAQVTFQVKDTGKGISPEDLGKLFQRFFQSASGKKYTGSGLGLFLCQQIMRAHNSEIRCESQVGVGSKFTFALPAYVDNK